MNHAWETNGSIPVLCKLLSIRKNVLYFDDLAKSFNNILCGINNNMLQLFNILAYFKIVQIHINCTTHR